MVLLSTIYVELISHLKNELRKHRWVAQTQMSCANTDELRKHSTVAQDTYELRQYQ